MSRRGCILLLVLCLSHWLPVTPLGRAATCFAAGEGPATAPPPAIPAPIITTPQANVRRAGQSRVVRQFDFEEAALGNFEDMPMYWFAIGRPPGTAEPVFLRQPVHQEALARKGFPAYAPVGFDKPQSERGNHALRLALDGGNVGVFLQMGTMPAVPLSDYQLSLRVRTTDMPHARALVRLYFLDAQGRRLDASTRTSPLLNTRDAWQRVEVRLEGDDENAAWIGIELLILQPTADPTDPLGDHQLIYQDVHGQAWFDDLVVTQIPRIEITSQSTVNILRDPEQPVLWMQVRDQTGAKLVAGTRVFDPRGKLVDQASHDLEELAPIRWQWKPKLPGYGWYMVELRLWDAAMQEPGGAPSDAGLVGRAYSAVLWLPAASEDSRGELADAEQDRFILDATGLPEAQLDYLPRLLGQTGLRGVTLSLWDHALTPSSLDAHESALEKRILSLRALQATVNLALAPVPDALVNQFGVDPHQPLPLWRGDESLWSPYLASIMLRQGQRVGAWQVGSSPEGNLPMTAATASDLQRVQARFRELAPRPHLLIPVSSHQARGPQLPDDAMVLLDVPPSIAAEHVGEYLLDWQQSPAIPTLLQLRQPGGDEMTQTRRADELALRMVHGWEAGAWGFSLRQPWTITDERRRTLAPDPLLGVYANVAGYLAGRRVLGRLDLGPGLVCMILDNPTQMGRDGMLVMWNTSAPPEEAVVDMRLGPHPVAMDLWGNRTPLSAVEGRHRLTLGASPIFIQGIDAPLAMFRARFKISPPFIESTQEPQTLKVTISNPWPRTITGTMQILEPAGWRIEPRRTTFNLPAGQSTTLNLEANVPVSELAGRTRFVARFDFLADQGYVVDLAVPLELGLRNITFDASLSLEKNPRTGQTDAVVTMLMQNRGTRAAALNASAHLPGTPRQERLIPRLEPGQSASRRFIFPEGAALLADHHLRLTLREASGPRMLNKIVSLDQAR